MGVEMTEAREVRESGGLGQIRDFIFARELAEVYLLLDHISGRPDKTLATAIKESGQPTNGAPAKGLIEKICEIGWPPKGTIVEQAEQAAVLLRAKDSLNAAAYPANGATIAFTLLVAGEDNTGAGRSLPDSPEETVWERLSKRFAYATGASITSAETARAQIVAASDATERKEAGTDPGLSALAAAAGDPSQTAAGRGWTSYVPSRTSLAQIAYPGLTITANRFNLAIKIIIGLLIAWLVFTCALSWNVAAGRAILGRLDAVATQRTDILKRIVEAENDETKQPPARGTVASAATVPGETGLVVRYCQRPLTLEPLVVGDRKIAQFHSVKERQLCDELNRNADRQAVS